MGSMMWKPSEQRKIESNLYRFMQVVNQNHHKDFQEYHELYEWSVKDVSSFWSELWDFAKIKYSHPFEAVKDEGKMPDVRWFPGAKLNFAENLLKHRNNQTALIFQGEGQVVRKLTYRELYQQVAQVAKSLRALNLKPGDRVVGYMPNMPETVIAMLAATSLGAVWSSCSPDFGIKGVLDRFGQIKPKVIFTADGYFFKGKQFDCLVPIAEILKQLSSVEKVVVIPYASSQPNLGQVPRAVHYHEFRSNELDLTIEFEALPFEHPLYIMYSSGTTGLPKCMVQSAGGILLNHQKELLLHADLKPDDVIFYFTTCGWMMWNWLISSLALGSSVVLYDGNPFHPDPYALWQLAQDEKITVFGTSAGYISALQNQNASPGKKYNLNPLKTILSTGSPLSVEGFDYVYREIKDDLQLASISGGSDINGCFAGGNSMDPVYRGELQCRCLGMDVEAFNEKGEPIRNAQGELVCCSASPSMPIYFWDDPGKKKYNAAYFDKYPHIWRHGDFIKINDRGGVMIYGRSDATLNPGGVRIGTAEIYRQVETIPEIEDSIVIGQSWNHDVRVILFVQMASEHHLNEEIKKKVKTTIRKNASPRHVPAKVIAVPEIPYTLNMKKVELAVKKTIENQEVLNKDALRNPGALEFFKGIKELKED